MYSSLPIPSDQIPDVIESSIAKELDPLFNYRPTGVPDAVLQGLQSKKFNSCIIRWFDSITSDPNICLQSKRSCFMVNKDAELPTNVTFGEQTERTSAFCSQMWSKDPFVGYAKIGFRQQPGQGQKMRVFFPGNAGSVFRLRSVFEKLKNSMTQVYQESFQTNEIKTLERMYELLEEFGSVSCADLSAFTSMQPRDILEAIRFRLLELAEGQSGIVTLVGPFQEEKQSLSEQLEKALTCILDTEIEGQGKILNGSTLGIPGGWLLCTLGHILQQQLELVQPLIKGDDVQCASDKVSIMGIQSDQEVSLPKSIFESRYEGTFLKKHLLFHYSPDPSSIAVAKTDPESTGPSEFLSGDESEQSSQFGNVDVEEVPQHLSGITLVGKFPIPIIRGRTQERKSKIISMVDSYAKDSSQLTDEFREFYKQLIFDAAAEVTDNKFLPLVEQSVNNHFQFHSWGTYCQHYQRFGDFEMSKPSQVNDDNWPRLQQMMLWETLGIFFDGERRQDKKQKLLEQEGKCTMKSKTSKVRFSELDAQADLSEFFNRKWIQQKKVVVDVTWIRNPISIVWRREDNVLRLSVECESELSEVEQRESSVKW